MNGEITVKSTPGVGSTFEITLRDVEISSGAFPAAGEVPFDIENISFESARVLVVDDVEFNRKLLRELLTEVDAEPLTAENGKQAILMAGEFQPHIILMDIRMPVMDGFEAAKRLKANPETRDIPIIGLSALPEYAGSSGMKDSGIDGYLTKPVNMNDLYGQLAKYLKHTIRSRTGIATAANVGMTKYMTAKSIKELPRLTKILREELVPALNGLTGVLKVGDIEKFETRISQLGSDFNVPRLMDYARMLREFEQNFDIENIERALAEFPGIVDALVKIKEKQDEQ